MNASKRTTIKSLLAAAMVLVENANSTTLCERNENIIFSCRLDRGKYVSICRSQNKIDLTYRFGRSDLVELEHTDTISKTSSFFYGKLDGAVTTAFELGFTRSDHKYTVYRYQDNEDGATSRGLHVDIPERKAGVDLRCRGDVVDEDFSKMIGVSCDDDMVVGCTRPERSGQWLMPTH